MLNCKETLKDLEFYLEVISSRDSDETIKDLTHKTFPYVQLPIWSFVDSSVRLEWCINECQASIRFHHTCSKSNCRISMSCVYILNFFKWLFCIHCIAWIFCFFPKTLWCSFRSFLNAFIRSILCSIRACSLCRWLGVNYFTLFVFSILWGWLFLSKIRSCRVEDLDLRVCLFALLLYCIWIFISLSVVHDTLYSIRSSLCSILLPDKRLVACCSFLQACTL